MKIKEIKYFLEVVKEESFTNAANKLYISQSALSKSVKNLEKEMKVQLIERNSKFFKLTYEGEVFYKKAKKSIEVIDEELNELKDIFNSSKKFISLGLPPVIGSVYFTSVIADFKKKNPNIDIKIIEEGSNEIKTSVEEEIIDIGAVIFPIEDNNLTTIPISSGKVMLIVSKDHRLSSYKKVRIDDLIEENFITFNEKFMMYNKTITACKLCGFEPNIILKTSQWDYIMEMVSLNQGISIMPEPIVRRFKTEDIVLIPIENQNINWDVGFILKKDKHISKWLKLFIEYTKEKMNNKYNNLS